MTSSNKSAANARVAISARRDFARTESAFPRVHPAARAGRAPRTSTTLPSPYSFSTVGRVKRSVTAPCRPPEPAAGCAALHPPHGPEHDAEASLRGARRRSDLGDTVPIPSRWRSNLGRTRSSIKAGETSYAQRRNPVQNSAHGAGDGLPCGGLGGCRVKRRRQRAVAGRQRRARPAVGPAAAATGRRPGRAVRGRRAAPRRASSWRAAPSTTDGQLLVRRHRLRLESPT